MLDHAPFPATASAEGAQFNVPPSPWRGKVGMALPLRWGRADKVPIPRSLIALLCRRGKRRWNEHLRLLAYWPLTALGRPGRQFPRLLTNLLPRCQIGIRPNVHPAIQPTDLTRHTPGNRRERGALRQRFFPGLEH